MKEISSFRPTSLTVEGGQYSGRSGRRAHGDIEAKKSSAAPEKSFQGSLAGSKTAQAQPDLSQTGTLSQTDTISQSDRVARSSSNATILRAIGANSSASRHNSASEGFGRVPSVPPRAPKQPVDSTPSTGGAGPSPGPTGPLKFNSLQQKWLDANTGNYANLMMENLSRKTPFVINSVDIRWVNGSTGKQESLNRAVGNVSVESGKQLAQLMGGTLVDGPFSTFGTVQRDQYIRMPNGQMIEASILASQLNAARRAADPFSATQGLLEVYKTESQNFNLATSTNIIDLANKGTVKGQPPSNSAT
jgi:hypothetical protein